MHDARKGRPLVNVAEEADQSPVSAVLGGKLGGRLQIVLRHENWAVEDTQG